MPIGVLEGFETNLDRYLVATRYEDGGDVRPVPLAPNNGLLPIALSSTNVFSYAARSRMGAELLVEFYGTMCGT
jgi:hypothetical protein